MSNPLKILENFAETVSSTDLTRPVFISDALELQSTRSRGMRRL